MDLAKYFNVRSVDYISKPRLLKEVDSLLAQRQTLLKELFIADPQNTLFEKYPEKMLASWRVERVRRIAGGSNGFR